MKQERVLTVLTVSNFIEFDLFRVDSIHIFKNNSKLILLVYHGKCSREFGQNTISAK